jgi:hypothetical protein
VIQQTSQRRLVGEPPHEKRFSMLLPQNDNLARPISYCRTQDAAYPDVVCGELVICRLSHIPPSITSPVGLCLPDQPPVKQYKKEPEETGPKQGI